MPEEKAAHVVIVGRVQGVGYRYFAVDAAREAGVRGWVRNCPNGDVECDVEGEAQRIDQWIGRLRQGPPLARVQSVHVEWRPSTRQYADFTIQS
ncbi:MAG TPA: acylphosphatase [Elusimicrobiota bacterium]|nr:acylphosphatase [Elusimicrobiota bacterium]